MVWSIVHVERPKISTSGGQCCGEEAVAEVFEDQEAGDSDGGFWALVIEAQDAKDVQDRHLGGKMR